ncbi:cytochrome c oxidase subunit II [Methylobacillus arboreus]|uniref:cytochrome c oxidase subunit II n=1 Tax=Methylobacillus arboreus TaxID=755170 RepID=UPI001E5D61F5|nr:cytochrome c oxidase subunit II [Methylobacillus arboreus]MCB5191488.1 cytochrome c oxidase subunit II [Methylobacillus arboreus]
MSPPQKNAISPKSILPGIVAAIIWLVSAFSPAYASQSALEPGGPLAAAIANLFWGMVVIGGIILFIVLAMLAVALLRARNKTESKPLTFTQSRNLVFISGVVIPALILTVFVISSAAVNREIVAPMPKNALTIKVTGHQWWWEVDYLDTEGNHIAKTANEIRIPVGKPVRIALEASDVIHSFWIPQLNGKTDMVPGKSNLTWVKADRPGSYRGQCTEFCGKQHAKMAFIVDAVPEEDFEAWLQRQAQPAREPVTETENKGRQVFLRSSCAMCHAIRGTSALASVAPDLTHIGSRKTLAAGSLENMPGTLSSWILSPQSFKPGSHMPATVLVGEDLGNLVEYLLSLE